MRRYDYEPVMRLGAAVYAAVYGYDYEIARERFQRQSYSVGSETSTSIVFVREHIRG